MPRRAITSAELASCGMKGEYLVVELISDHAQPNCPTIAAPARGIVTGNKRPTKHIVLFPHSVEPKGSLKVFLDGTIRIVDPKNYRPVGRIDVK